MLNSNSPGYGNGQGYRSKGSAGIIRSEEVPVIDENKQRLNITQAARKLDEMPLLSPIEIYEKLNQYVIGQDKAKKVLSVAAANHVKRLKMGDDSVKKSNVLIIGPSGCGKTYLVETLAKILNLSYASCSASSLTAAGYVGNDVDEVLRSLIVNASSRGESDNQNKTGLSARAMYRVAEAESGIIFLDEIDKICKHPGAKDDIGGERVQQALLTMLEGSVFNVNMSTGKNPSVGAVVPISTKNILFICGGAFPGISTDIKNRLTEEGVNIYDLSEDDILDHLNEADLENYFIDEFIGRIPVTVTLKNLSTDDFVKIMTVPKNAIFSQYRKLFEMDGSSLSITEDAIRYIADKAREKHRGARGLRTVIEEYLADAQFISASYKNMGLEFFMARLKAGGVGVVVKAPKSVCGKIEEMISKGKYGEFSIMVTDR